MSAVFAVTILLPDPGPWALRVPVPARFSSRPLQLMPMARSGGSQCVEVRLARKVSRARLSKVKKEAVEEEKT